MVYVETPKESTKKLLKLVSDYSEVAGYKVNVQQSIVSLYGGNELLKFDIKSCAFSTKTKQV